jgi:hypothetical protein
LGSARVSRVGDGVLVLAVAAFIGCELFSKDCFGATPLERLPATAGKLCNGQAFKPARETRALPKNAAAELNR